MSCINTRNKTIPRNLFSQPSTLIPFSTLSKYHPLNLINPSRQFCSFSIPETWSTETKEQKENSPQNEGPLTKPGDPDIPVGKDLPDLQIPKFYLRCLANWTLKPNVANSGVLGTVRKSRDVLVGVEEGWC